MILAIEPCHDLTPTEIDEIEGRLYEHNSHATGHSNGQALGFIIRDEVGQKIGVAAGYTWAGISELRQMWGTAPPNFGEARGRPEGPARCAEEGTAG